MFKKGIRKNNHILLVEWHKLKYLNKALIYIKHYIISKTCN